MANSFSISSRRLVAGLLVLLLLAGCATQNEPAPVNTTSTSANPTASQAENKPQVLPYPIKNPLLATVMGTPEKLRAVLPTNAPISIETLAPLVSRDTPPTLRYARPLQYLLTTQDKPAPLAFVIAGTGNTALSGNCVLLSRALYAVGYSVACLPSPTTVTFMLGAAKHPVPGRMPSDVDDLYHMMSAIRGQLSKRLDITGYSLAGWSLGATEAAFLAHKDTTRQQFNFQHVLLIEPAVNVWASVKRMDALLNKDLPGGIDNMPRFLANVLGDIKQVYANNKGLKFNSDTLFKAYAGKIHNPQRTGALIGIAFRMSLANMAFAADELSHSGVIVPKDMTLGPYDNLAPYFKSSIRMSFSDYLNGLLVPYWNRDGHHVTRMQIIQEANLHKIASFLASDSNIAVFANADDPILDKSEVAFLRKTFGDRARIRPYGGHLGNLAYKKTIQALQDYFSP